MSSMNIMGPLWVDTFIFLFEFLNAKMSKTSELDDLHVLKMHKN